MAIIFAFAVLVYFVGSRGWPKEYSAEKHFVLFVIWLVVIICFLSARITAIQGYQALIKHFVTIRQNMIANIISERIDPFDKKS